MRQRKIPFAAMLLLTLVLLAAPMLTLNFASRRGSPAADVSIEALALEDDHFSMTASLEGKSAAAFRRAAWEIKNDTLYITLFSGLVRGGCCQDQWNLAFEDDALRDVRQVCLRGRSVTRLIYSR